jgi:uncharacterized membrane protein
VAVRYLHVLAMALLASSWMASEYSRWDDGTLHVKLALVVLAGVLILWLGLALAH